MTKILIDSLKLSIFSVVGITTFVHLPSQAQQVESFSSCVLQLDRQLYINDAIRNCKEVFRGKPINENYSTCVENLDTALYINDAVQHCSEVFQNSAQAPQQANSTPGGTTIIINPGQSEGNQGIRLNPTSQAGNYWVYQKPSNVSADEMQAAGAAFYSGPQACSVHYSLCTNLGGSWLSQQRSLSISPSVSSAAAPSELPLQGFQSTLEQNNPVYPRSDTEIYLIYYRECIDRLGYRTLRGFDRAIATNGYNMGYKFGRKPGDLSDEQMKSVGLRWDWTFQSWIGPQPEVKIPIMDSSEAARLCRQEIDNATP